MAEDRITIATLRKLLATRTGFPEKACGDFIDALLKAITNGLQDDKQVRINGLGTFKVQWNEPRKSVNVKTGEPILIDGYNKVTFTPDSTLKDRINEPFAHLEAIVIDENKPQEKNEIDPMQKFGEQAEEIKDILAELGAITSETQQTNEQPQSEQPEEKKEEKQPEEKKEEQPEEKKEEEEQEEKKEETTKEETQKEETTPSTPNPTNPNPPTPNPPTPNPPTPNPPTRTSSEKVLTKVRTRSNLTKKEKSFQPWKVAGITVLCFCALLVAGYFFLQHKITSWADSLLNKGEEVAVVEPNETVLPDSIAVCPATDSIAIMPDSLQEPAAEAEQTTADQSTAEQNTAEQNAEKAGSTVTVPRTYTDFIKTETLTEGSRLAWLSKKYYGAKDFWVYIYEANKDILPDPNAIPVGTQIRIPRLPKDLIDTNNPESMNQAKALQDQILNNK